MKEIRRFLDKIIFPKYLLTTIVAGYTLWRKITKSKISFRSPFFRGVPLHTTQGAQPLDPCSDQACQFRPANVVRLSLSANSASRACFCVSCYFVGFAHTREKQRFSTSVSRPSSGLVLDTSKTRRARIT